MKFAWQLAVGFTKDQAAWIRDRAARQGIPAGAVVRDAVEGAMARHALRYPLEVRAGERTSA